ncbi:nuclear transport factor 2 family protein [Nocardioides sp. LS1]|uniref:nuclear transport factor 2 family protein n=1 Tax=Nocardioides sp. LS1 TaxID=1027620 RepID=UPI000F621FA7|nr:nuclear transport factor 2 family protein [Nocardioides sp. LS1]GCD88089.1 hypothetical protein NLS1_00950 [Nocardioides sp. LS1]
MTGPTAPAAIQRFIDTTNDSDTDGFLDVFTDNAVLIDWGRVFQGRAAIAQWNETDNIGVHTHFELKALLVEDEHATYTATLKVSGDGFNGTGPMTFKLRGDQIEALTITSA